ncbi:hypothetical protein J6590_082716 [Homalodisca vitripennis]|nr:hypothetical protein J6590_082716 [Homalodisca vitripennis]
MNDIPRWQSIRGEEFACGRRGVKSSRGEEPGTENTHSPYIVYLPNHNLSLKQHNNTLKKEETSRRYRDRFESTAVE